MTVGLLVTITTKLKIWWYRFVTACRALYAIYYMPKDTVDAFMQSYELFEQESMNENKGEEHSHQMIRDYYAVINYLCAIGEVEKMYIPPTIDPSVGVFANQLLFEEKMVRDLSLDKNMKVLDVGCGRGRVAGHMARESNCDVYGINIDKVQLEKAEEFRLSNPDLTDRLHFQLANFNDPFPFSNEFFDGLYQIQVLTYARSLESISKEMFRVLKPGAKVSFLDWVRLDKYDPQNKHHQILINKVKPLIGAVTTPSPRDFEDALEKAGFKVLFSGDASIGGHQADLIEKTCFFYETFTLIINTLVALGLPKHLKILFDRLTKGGDAFIEADRLGIFTTSYQLIAQKPY